MMTARQIQTIYGLGAKIGIVGSDRDDELHALIGSLTGKDSVKALDENEYKIVVNELVKRAETSGKDKKRPKKQHEQSVAGMTVGQQKKVWYLMYQLQGCDTEPSAVSIGDRLCGIIKRELGIDATAKNPFAWISYQEGSVLIERLKNYVSSAERKVMRGGRSERQ